MSEKPARPYKPVPEDLDEIHLNSFACGRDCCGAVYFVIMASTKSDQQIRLWKSPSFFYFDDKEELNEFRKVVQEAADYYKLNVDLDYDCVFDWE